MCISIGGIIHDESMDYNTMAFIKRTVVAQYQHCCSAAQQQGSKPVNEDLVCLTGQVSSIIQHDFQ